MLKRYTDEFVADVKAAFPGYGRLHQALDANEELVDTLLQSAKSDIPAATVLSLIDCDLAELRRQAERQVLINELYRKWLEFIAP